METVALKFQQISKKIAESPNGDTLQNYRNPGAIIITMITLLTVTLIVASQAQDVIIPAIQKNVANVYANTDGKFLALILPQAEYPLSFPGSDLEKNLLHLVDSIPECEPIFKSRDEDIRSRFKQLLSLAAFGVPEPNALEEDDLADAKKLIFEDATSEQYSLRYQKYTNLKQKVSNLENDLRTSGDAEQALILLQLKQARGDLAALRDLSELQAAETILAKFDRTPLEKQRIALMSDLDKAAPRLSNIPESLKQREGWTTQTLFLPGQSGNKSAAYNTMPNVLICVKSGKKTEIPILVNAIYSITKKVAVVRGYFSTSFFEKDNWKLKNGFLASDGLPADQPNELLPRYVSDIIIARQLDIFLVDKFDISVAAENIKIADEVYWGPFQLKGSTIGSPFVTEGLISCASPQIFACVITEIPPSPNPSNQLKWKP